MEITANHIVKLMAHIATDLEAARAERRAMRTHAIKQFMDDGPDIASAAADYENARELCEDFELQYQSVTTLCERLGFNPDELWAQADRKRWTEVTHA